MENRFITLMIYQYVYIVCAQLETEYKVDNKSKLVTYSVLAKYV